MPAYDLDSPANHLAPVRFTLEIERDEPSAWTVRSFDIDERLSQPTRIELDALTGDPKLDTGALLGRSAALSLDRDGPPRTFAGLIIGVEERSRGEDQLGVHLRIAPALALLRHRHQRRIWQLKSVVEICTAILRGPLAAHGRSLRWELDASAYEPREYCVQHGESDLDMVHRLLAEEGIYYRFEVEEGREVVVFADSSARAPVISVASSDPERREEGVLPFIPTGAGSTGEESISDFSWRRDLVPTATLTRTWDWRDATSPPEELHTEDYAPDPGVAEPEGDRTVHEIVAPSRTSERSQEHLHRVRHQRRALTSARGYGRGDAIGLRPGYRFALVGHPDPKCDRGYLLTRARHRGDAPEVQLHAHADAQLPRYGVDLTCIAEETPFRPPAPPAVRARLETAIVVGPPPPEEIHTDEHGRVQVRFHWDRRCAEEASTCWLRVTQSWAGIGFGALFVPRIGQEVVVDYLDGDPDRPLIVGSLYNSRHRPPFELPQEKERSGLRSDSTPGGGGHHELSFDDTKGREVLRIRAQRDMSERVLHDKTTVVGRQRTIEVGEHYAREVGGLETLTVTESATRWVGGHYNVCVASGDLETLVEKGDVTMNLAEGAALTTAEQDIALQSRAGSIACEAQVELNLESVRGALQLCAGTDLRAHARSGDLTLHAEKAALVALAAKRMDLTVTDGLLNIYAAKGLQMETDNYLKGVATEGLMLESPKTIILKCGASSLTISSTSIVLDSPTISSSAVGAHRISGSTISLN